MQKHIIFVATNDPDFERSAMGAILDTRHGMRKTGDAHDVWRLLTLDDTEGLALAVIDVDFDPCGLTLLHILRSSDPPFPVLAVAARPEVLFTNRHDTCRHSCGVGKPVAEEELRELIAGLCNTEPPGLQRRRAAV